jgi:phage-related protein
MTFNPANVFNFVAAHANTSATRKPRLVTAKYGDGYEQRSKSGDINALQTWQLVFNDRDWNELLAIDNFLKGLHGVDAFVWDSPQPFGQGWFICKKWNYTWNDGVVVGINATFEERNGPPLAATLNWAGQDFESYTVGAVFSIGGASAHSGDCTLGPGAFGVDNLNWAADDFEIYAAGNVTGTLSQSTNSGDTTLGVASFSYFVDDTVDWAADDFELSTPGNISTVGLNNVSVGDVDLLTGSFASFPIPLNYGSDDFEMATTGSIASVTANTNVGDSSLGSGYFNP